MRSRPPDATSSPADVSVASNSATPTARIPAILFITKPPVWKPNPARVLRRTPVEP